MSIVIVWILIAILLARFFYIQILSHDRYRKKANTNRIRKVTTTAPRGLILDRNGHILVDNLPTYVLTAIPGELSEKGQKFGFISKIIGLDSIRVSKNYSKYYRGRFISTRLAKDLTFTQISKLEENKLDLEGIYYQQIPERYFPSRVRASHILGYVKEVDKKIRKSIPNKSEYELGDMIGWNGLEKKYELYLKGKRGVKFYEVDNLGREVGYVSDLPLINPKPGQNIVTTIDIEIQESIEALMKNKRGVILVGNPSSGEILGAVSAPDYKPDLFTGLMLEEDWKNILYDPGKPLINRFNSGLYPPGSIVKMVTVATLMKNPKFDPLTLQDCAGAYQFGDRLFGCWLGQGHGKMNLNSALINSCDVYFYKTVNLYDLGLLSDTFNEFGFGATTKVDIIGEAKGLVPNKAYMNKKHGRYGWSKGAILNFSIGQGELLVTPIQVLNYINLLATRGEANTPHFVLGTSLPENTHPQISSENWDRIINAMGEVISHDNGTGKKAQPNSPMVKVYGKTGTAENPHGNNHAWFVGWAEFSNQNYSIVVLLENAGSGGAVAAPIAGKVFTNILKKQDFASK
ncbi:MAG: penicillin-binding protein 2 [Candidatus Marinimicrobia bacterium]|nr:penicillin-binding protein 2 [Candidatus Neomarinimicrobiota bacterium]